MGRVCPLVVEVEVSDLFLSCVRCEVDGIVVLLVGEKPLSFPPLELFICECTLLGHFSSIVLAHNLHCCWNCSQSHPNCGYDSNWPWCLLGIVFNRPSAQIH